MSTVLPSLPAIRQSPIEAWIETKCSGEALREQMRQPTRLGLEVPTGTAVTLTEVSWRRRLGLKGPQAERWLGSQQLTVPAPANSYAVTDGVMVARLATSEFLVEALLPAAQARIASLATQLYGVSRTSGVYAVPRQDLVVELSGPALGALLRQVCSVDFEPMLGVAAPEGPLVLTSMVGVGVVAVPIGGDGRPGFTLWADPSFGHYFWTTLIEVAADLKGGVRLDAFNAG
jgi:sarcosine oxidase subunit gamma